MTDEKMGPREYLLKAQELLESDDARPVPGGAVATTMEILLQAQWHMQMAQLGDLLQVAEPARFLREIESVNRAANTVLWAADRLVHPGDGDDVLTLFVLLQTAVDRWLKVKEGGGPVDG